jgi:DNA segregation ATPase FtsK/SpoIIIE-like protein
MSHRQVMQSESNIILGLLRERKVRANVTGGYVTPGYYVYELRMDATQRYSKLEECAEDMQRLLYAVRVRNKMINANDPDQTVVVRIQMQPLVVEVNRPIADILHYDDVRSRSEKLQREFVAVAGVAYLTKEGQSITWRLDDPAQPHCMVAGGTGSGKSMLLLGLVLSACENTSPLRLRTIIIDGGNSTLKPLAELPHCIGHTGDVDGALHLAKLAHDETLRRKTASLTDVRDRLLVVVDELANLQAVMDKSQVADLQRYMNVVTAEGRKFGVHCAICTQKPLAEVTGSLTKTNTAKRFVGAMPSKGDAHTASGISGTGAEALAGKGDFVTVRNSVVRRFQAAYVGDVVAVVNRVRRKYAGVGARQIEPVRAKRAVAQNPQREPAFEPVRTGSEPVHEPPTNHLEPVFEPASGSPFPITDKRPLTKREAAIVRHLAESMSKNALCITVYGAKSGRYMEWINAALEPPATDDKIIRLRKTA